MSDKTDANAKADEQLTVPESTAIDAALREADRPPEGKGVRQLNPYTGEWIELPPSHPNAVAHKSIVSEPPQ